LVNAGFCAKWQLMQESKGESLLYSQHEPKLEISTLSTRPREKSPLHYIHIASKQGIGIVFPPMAEQAKE
jgi:hypothetical protein